MKKVLILIGDAGGGHIACARALEKAFQETDYKASIRTVKSYDAVYAQISKIKILEKIFNYSYILSDKYDFIAWIFSTYFKLTLAKRTREIIEEENPDVVISNHSMTALSIGYVRKNIKNNFEFIVTVPDLITVSRYWIECEPDILFSPTPEATKVLRKYNTKVPIKNDYYPLQEIPTYSKTKRSQIKREIFSQFALDVKKPTILITGCGLGTRNIVKNIHNLLVDDSYQFIILTGKDKELENELIEKYSKYKNIGINGYTNEMLNFIIAVDIVIAKTGPATILEIEELDKKGIFTQPVGYQEWGNVDYLKKNPNFRFVGDKYQELGDVLKDLLDDGVVDYESDIRGSKDIINIIINR